VSGLLALGLASERAGAQSDASGYVKVEGFFQLPADRPWGSITALDIDRDGRSIWAATRCGANTCAGASFDPILKFDATGKVTRSFGAGMFVQPHGIWVDGSGDVWVTDGQGDAGKGHVVVKFSPEGNVLMTLGTPGVAGADEKTFNQPSDVVTSSAGDIFVADGHGSRSNARIVKFSKDGRFLKAWGTQGSRPGEFNTPHTIAMDSRGRLYVGDRGNERIQIFDQDGRFIAEWRQFGRTSSLAFDRDDTLYAACQQGAHLEPGLRVGTIEGAVKDYVPILDGNTEGIAVDAAGNVYSSEVDLTGKRPNSEMGITKWTKKTNRVRP
jgi:sugar lactone lactonase YvrE